MKEVFFVTGGAGYVGNLLIQKLIENIGVEKIVVLDKDPLREDLRTNMKVVFIQKNLVENWEEIVSNFNPTKVVHLAWQIRTMYGKEKLQNHWNIDGTQKVFDFVKNSPTVKTFIHFSTVASYGAFPTNTFLEVFTENIPFRKTNYLYAEEKRIAEENLDKMFTFIPGETGTKNIFVIRPASITGQKGRERTSFGLQSALSGKIASQNFLFKMISKALQFMPATHGWARQFVHENDIVNAVLTMSFSHKTFSGINAYNLCPGGGYIDAKEMAGMLHKKCVYIHPQLIRVLCFLAWHGTHGKVPTSRGVWKAYSYPIIVDGSKIERDFPEFKYQKNIRQAYLG